MRTLILADEFFASREQALLSRLEVGLLDEGVRLVHAIPEAARSFAPGDMISKVVPYTERGWQFGHGAWARRLARQVMAGEESAEIDIIHVFGGSAWPLAGALASELGASLVVEAWRLGLGERARHLASRAEPAPLFIAPDPAIERGLREEPGALSVRLIPWGVHTPPETREVLPPDRSISAMMVGTGRDVRAFTAAFEGLAGVMRNRPDFMVFCDHQAASRAELWSLAKRLGVLDRLTMIGELEGRRDLVLQGDVLVQPDSRGEQRSATLDAMSHGMLVLAAADAGVATLIDGRTARLVGEATPRAWTDAMEWLLADVPRARGLAESARRFVREQRRASDQVRALLEAYSWLRSADAIPFTSPPPVRPA